MSEFSVRGIPLGDNVSFLEGKKTREGGIKVIQQTTQQARG
jgi:hypothetical protein